MKKFHLIFLFYQLYCTVPPGKAMLRSPVSRDLAMVPLGCREQQSSRTPGTVTIIKDFHVSGKHRNQKHSNKFFLFTMALCTEEDTKGPNTPNQQVFHS